MPHKRLLKYIHLPRDIEYKIDEKKHRYGKIKIYPFVRGMGTTFANSMRRVLLSSLPGYAITAIKIEGISHEYEPIPGMLEDTLIFMLNLKRVRLKLEDEAETKVIRIEKKGPGVFKAGDLAGDPSVSIVNPDLVLANLNEDANIVMELQIDMGVGYLSSEEMRPQIAEVGVFPVDAIFSPIEKVSFKIEPMSIGQKSNYESAIIELWTDATITPEDAIATAAKILKDHFALLINFNEADLEEEPEESKEDEELEKMRNILLTNVEELELSVRASNCLKTAKIKTIADLVKKTEEEIIKTKNFGKKSLNEILEKLKQLGLTLGMTDIDKYLTPEVEERIKAKKKEKSLINIRKEA